MPRINKDGQPAQPGAAIKTEKAPKIGGVGKIKKMNPIHRLGDYAHPPGGYKKKGK